MAVCLVQSRHLPSSLALCRCSWASCRWYSLRSGVLFLAWSYSRRVSLAVSGSLALVAGGLFQSPLGFGLGSFFLARVVCLVPARGLRGSGKVCWNVILLEPCAGEPCPSSGASSAFRVYPRACGSTRSGAGPGSAMRRFTPAARGLPLRADSKEMSLRFIPAARGPACVRHFSGISLEVWFSPGAEFRLAFPARVTLPCSPSTVRCTLGSSAGGLGLIRSGRCSRCSS